MANVRLDKWLWAARFFKTRSLATRACELGRIQCNKQPAKPARDVHVGDLLQIRTEGPDFEVEVLSLSDFRGPASYHLGTAPCRNIKVAPCGAKVHCGARRIRRNHTAKTQDILRNLERETGFEPATSTLARSHSTTELLPLSVQIINYAKFTLN